jgi:hypothetical protein
MIGKEYPPHHAGRIERSDLHLHIPYNFGLDPQLIPLMICLIARRLDLSFIKTMTSPASTIYVPVSMILN